MLNAEEIREKYVFQYNRIISERDIVFSVSQIAGDEHLLMASATKEFNTNVSLLETLYQKELEDNNIKEYKPIYSPRPDVCRII